MIYTAGELNNYFNAGLMLWDQEEDGTLEFVGKDKNWTAYTWLEDGVDLERVHEYLMLRA